MGIGSSSDSKEDQKELLTKPIFSPITSSSLDLENPAISRDATVETEASSAVVFRWKQSLSLPFPEEIYLSGDWDPYNPVQMICDSEPPNSNPEKNLRSKFHDKDVVFLAIVYLGPGKYHYHFIIDGKPKLAPDQPISNSCNVITVTNNTYQTLPEFELDDNTKWGQVIPEIPILSNNNDCWTQNKNNKGPPELPAHLRRALLNSQPTVSDVSTLPLPHNVMLNHLYSRPSSKNAYILGLTIRYREKFVTLVYYKPSKTKSCNKRITDF